MALHGEVGPRESSIKAIAERAGVERLTVYRHFPDQAALFEACTGHWQTLNPPPDPSLWQSVSEPHARANVLLEALYGYFARTATMWRLAYRDRDDVPGMSAPMRRVDNYLERLASDLVKGRHGEKCHVTARHLVQFGTWESLDAQGLKPAEMAGIGCRWLDAVSSPGL